MRVVAVVLNWNGCADTRACLASLAASDAPLDALVVDNGSTECPPERLAEGIEGPGLRSLRLHAAPQNLGFARGMNLGIDLALKEGADAVWLLNNDVTVAPDAGRRLAEALEGAAHAAVVGPAVYDARTPGLLSNAGGGISLARGRTWHLPEGAEAPPRAAPYEVAYVEGSAPMMRAEDLRGQGGFDASYGAYWEDVDWCLTARRRGRRALVVPAARVVHKVSSSSGVASPYALYHRARNRFRCVRRHGAALDRAILPIVAFAELPVVLYHARRAGSGASALAWWRGTVDGLRGREAPWT